MADPGADVGAIDQATHTLYASDSSGTVAVIDTATCNADDTAGCAAHPLTISIGADPGPPALNASTKTLYLPFGSAGNRVAVVNIATCNATDTSSCTVPSHGQGRERRGQRSGSAPPPIPSTPRTRARASSTGTRYR